MSDEEFYSEESYEFEFEEDDENESIEVDPDDQSKSQDEDQGILLQDRDINLKEQRYYSAKALKFDDTNSAITAFNTLIEIYDRDTEDETNTETVEWIFKSYKQLMKIHFNSGDYVEFIDVLKKLLHVLPKVNRNYGEESLSRIINNYSISNNQQFISNLYSTILGFLNQPSVDNGSNYDRLWIKISLYKLTSMLDSGEFQECPVLIEDINRKLETVPRQVKKSYALDLIALEIQFFSENHDPQKIPQSQVYDKSHANLSKLNQLYRKSLEITTTVTHPKILGIIRECGGKIQFYRGNYEKARLEFYESFNNYDEAGSSLKKKVLKYVSLCSLLTENQFNPFGSQETSTYSSLPEYSNLLELIQCYDDLDLAKFGRTLDKIRREGDPMTKDEIFNNSTDLILKNLTTKSILQTLKAYRTIKFAYIQNKFGLTQKELEDLLVKLSLSGKLSDIKIDFVNEVIISEESGSIIPINLNPKDIYINMKISDEVKYDSYELQDSTDDGMEIDDPLADPIPEETEEEVQDPASQTIYSRSSRELNDLRAPRNSSANLRGSRDSYGDTRESMRDTFENIRGISGRRSRSRGSSVGHEIRGRGPGCNLWPTSNRGNNSIPATSKLLYLTEKPAKENDWLKIIAFWSKTLFTFVPKPAKTKLSQKDQIEFRQRNENAVNATLTSKIKKDEEGDAPGMLNAIEDDEELDEDDDEPQTEVHKVDLLASWKRELDDYYGAIVRIP